MTEDEINDAAAETDTDPQNGTAGAAPKEPASESFKGRCVGGPWDTSDAESRFPKGFLLIHKPDHALWIYDRRDDGNYYVRQAEPERLDDDKREKAAEGRTYDIRVLDPTAVEPAVKP